VELGHAGDSEAMLPSLPVVMAGPDAWDADETIRRAIGSAGRASRTRASSPSRALAQYPYQR
jgi:hypothetical protein